MKKTYTRYLSFILLKTFGISSLITFFACAIYNSNSNGFEARQGEFIETVALIFWMLVLTISSSTIYLNRISRVRETPALRMLSFFLIPVLILVVTWCLGDRSSDWSTFYMSTAIYLLTIAFFYLKFIKSGQQMA